MNNTITLINSFNTAYHFIDANKEYKHHARIERDINKVLETLSLSELVELKNEIHSEYSEYFKLDEMIKELTPSKMSTIMTVAHQYRKEGLFPTFSDCLIASHLRYKLLTELYKGNAKFQYRKAKGEKRTAHGMIDTMPINCTNPKVISYMDHDVSDYRRCRIDRLISIA